MAEMTGTGEEISLYGAYTLEHWVGGDRASGYFGARGEDGERALVKLVPEGGAGAERQFAIWQRARHLRHAHVLDVRDVGKLEAGGDRYVYVAFEYPDDRLATALEKGPLTVDEARGVVEAVIDALRYLHGQGLAHGAIDPLHVVATGDTVKLITDSLREPDGMDAFAEDVRQLGELVKRMRAPEDPGEPLATIARHAADPNARNRWTLAEIARVLAAPAGVPPVAPELPVVQAESEVQDRPVLPPPHVRRNTVAPVSPMPFPKWIFAAAGLLLLLILVLNLRHKPAPVATPAQSVPASPVPPPGPAVPASRDPKAETARVAQPKPLPPQPVRAGTAERVMWRVIAYTYGSYDMASKKARQVNQRYPDLHAVVFVPGERRGYYLVALGGRMTREDAVRLQRRARGMGFPGDVYVQNYNE
ncbi:MAG: protein kinase family protein [Acidobacteria bacterium]|nr:protein kinase family protein [Acidobacteriota bacterium]